MTPVLVTGARSIVGRFLLPRLVPAGYDVHAVTRRAAVEGALGSAARWHTLDISRGLAGLRGEMRVLIHLAPIWLLPGIVEDAARLGVERILAFSSTSRFTKEDSTDPSERRLATRLAMAEAEVISRAALSGAEWTIFRPTMIYARGADRNVSSIARFIRRFRMFPIVGAGHGLRQPVHADDLAAACVAALATPTTLGRSYNLGGGSQITYADMVREIFRGLGLAPRLVRIPLPLMRGALVIAGRLPRLHDLTPAVAERMNRDLAFDWTDAETDFGYAPRPFAFPQ